MMEPGQPVGALARAADWEEGLGEEWEDEDSDLAVYASVRPVEWRNPMNEGYRVPARRVPSAAANW